MSPTRPSIPRSLVPWVPVRVLHTLMTLLIALTISTESQAATRVELVVDEPFNARTVPWPVTTGVPFPRGAFTAEQHCRLIDDLGNEQPLQSRVAATWDAERSSIRWLTIDFIARPGRAYVLEFGSDVARATPPSRLRAAGSEVVTGPLRMEFSEDGPSAIAAIDLDLDHDGHFTDTERIATGSAQGEHYYIDQNGRRFSTVGDATDREIVIETAGPIRACVRVDGFYSGPDGSRIVAVRTRYHLFVGLPLIKAVHEFRVVGSTRTTRFRDIGFELHLPGGHTPQTVVVDESGDPGNQLREIEWQSETIGVSSFQETYRHFGNPECRGSIVERLASTERVAHETDHVGEWLQVQNDNVAVTGSLRWMWQQFPKEWEVTGDSLKLHLWSPRADALDFGADGIRSIFGEGGRRDLLEWEGVPKRPNAISNFFYRAGHQALKSGDVDGQGINKHHEFWLHFGAANESRQGQEYGQLAASQLLALATPEWNCASDVFGPLEPKGTSRYEGIVDRIFDLGRYAQDAFGDYGWWIFGSGPHYSYQWDKESGRHYADPRRFEYHTYQKETQLWWNYFRSGERKFYDWAVPSENHWVDVAVTHVPVTYKCAWRGGFTMEQTLHMQPGDWSIDSPLFYVRQRDSAEAWLRGCSQFQASYHRTLETTTLAYYITGDERFNDVIQFWKGYWIDLAGKTSASQDMPVWFREQPWYQHARSGEPVKTWAEMIRDYCPFTSGLRHQMTYFFSLATLYEHTWDPVIGQVLHECADAYIDADHRIGVWRTQENRLPTHADAPKLAHYWIPALWKYARATQDPRMPEVFRRYFDACYAADPFEEDLGQYSDVHIGYACYFTRDARHLRAAVLALDDLLPNAAPLTDPAELNGRLYNPYTPIQCFTAVPRLLWALKQAERDGVRIPDPPLLMPQRAAVAVGKAAGKPLRCTLWGYDRELIVFTPDGHRIAEPSVRTTRAASDIQPFDRVTADFEVFLHELTIPATEPAGCYIVAPTLELAVLSSNTSQACVGVNAAMPVALHPEKVLVFVVPDGCTSIDIEIVDARPLLVTAEDGTLLRTSVQPGGVSVDVASQGRVHIQRQPPVRNRRQPVWFRIVGLPREQCWVHTLPGESFMAPTAAATLAAIPIDPRKTEFPDSTFVDGRFGRGLLIKSGRSMEIIDHAVINGESKRLFNSREGTVEFHIRQLWDPRLVGQKRVNFLTNGIVSIWNQQPLPVGAWAHLAFEWRPLKRDPSRIALHVYVDGLDRRNYRSTWWEGYSQKPLTLPRDAEWQRAFTSIGQAGTPYVIDEIRVSSVARYARQDVELGGQQVFNPAHFQPATQPFKVDEHTTLLLHLDGDGRIESSVPGVSAAARIEE